MYFTAPAKLNLSLRVIQRRPDGFHHLQSVVAFGTCADQGRLTASDKPTELRLAGPFARALQPEPSSKNSVIQAIQWTFLYFDRPEETFQIALDKQIPVAAGLGGGSSDAAAAIYAIVTYLGIVLSVPQQKKLVQAAWALGDDVPVCLAYQLGWGDAFWVDGPATERVPQPISMPESFLRMPLLLINPCQPTLTASVFKHRSGPFTPAQSRPSEFQTQASLFAYISNQGNDLSKAARCVAPALTPLLTALGQGGALIFDMTGSGASCFSFFKSTQSQTEALSALTKIFPQGWFHCGRLASSTFKRSA